MPQIAQLAETWSSQVFWLLVFFGITFFVIGRGMVPKVMETVAQRDSQIAADLGAAKAARDAADEQEEAVGELDKDLSALEEELARLQAEDEESSTTPWRSREPTIRIKEEDASAPSTGRGSGPSSRTASHGTYVPTKARPAAASGESPPRLVVYSGPVPKRVLTKPRARRASSEEE